MASLLTVVPRAPRSLSGVAEAAQGTVGWAVPSTPPRALREVRGAESGTRERQGASAGRWGCGLKDPPA